MEFDIVVKGIRYDLHAYKELRDEWDWLLMVRWFVIVNLTQIV